MPKGAKWADVYADYTNNTNKVKITATPNIRSLDKYSHPNFPGFPLAQIGVVIAEAETAGSVQAFRNFRQWIRNTLVPPANP